MRIARNPAGCLEQALDRALNPAGCLEQALDRALNPAGWLKQAVGCALNSAGGLEQALNRALNPAGGLDPALWGLLETWPEVRSKVGGLIRPRAWCKPPGIWSELLTVLLLIFSIFIWWSGPEHGHELVCLTFAHRANFGFVLHHLQGQVWPGTSAAGNRPFTTYNLLYSTVYV